MATKQQGRARMRKLSGEVARDAERQRAERRQKRAALKAARAERIRATKEKHPDETWAEIGDFCGVSDRAAQAWQEKGSISAQHARKLAEFWAVDFDWLYWGAEEGAPASTLDSIDLRLIEVQRKVDLLEGLIAPADALRNLRRRAEEAEPPSRSRNREDNPGDDPGARR